MPADTSTKGEIHVLYRRGAVYQGYKWGTAWQTLVLLEIEPYSDVAHGLADAWWDNGDDLGERLDGADYNEDRHPWYEWTGAIDDLRVRGTYRRISRDEALTWGRQVIERIEAQDDRKPVEEN